MESVGIIHLYLAILAFLTLTVNGHGSLSKFNANGGEYDASPLSSSSENVGWIQPDNALAEIWVQQDMYTSSEIVCGRGYRAGNAHARVAAGEQVTVTWAGWPKNHRGAILDYMANCNGPCNQADKTQLKWFKIQQVGLLVPKINPEPDRPGYGTIGYWATDKMCESTQEKKVEEKYDYVIGPKWQIAIPANLAPGYYTLRTEILALYVADNENQHYPRCVNIEITGNGSDRPTGVVATELYNMNQAGLALRPDTTTGMDSYTFPGPPLYQG